MHTSGNQDESCAGIDDTTCRIQNGTAGAVRNALINAPVIARGACARNRDIVHGACYPMSSS
jgi:hypothetical protein